MVKRLGVAIVGLAIASPVHAQSALEEGFAGALRGCEEWVLNPASWGDGLEPFMSTVGLGNRMGLVESVNEAALPPREMRVANYFWRINSTEDAGYILVVSDQVPMCHITGGGGSDLQPLVESVLNGEEFQSHWEKLEDDSRGEMTTTVYRNREEPDFSMAVSRANSPGQRLDRVQVVVTAILDFGG